MDGAMGTMLQGFKPTPADFGGETLENCNENLCRTRPGWILDIHRAYLAVGADIIATNSFQGSPAVLAEFGLADDAHELNMIAARLARQAADEFSTTSRPRFVAGAMGPGNKSISLHADVTFHHLRDSYFAQARGLISGGADLLLLETAFDTRNIKAGLSAIRKLEHDTGRAIPLMISGTIERWGAMLAGQSVDAFYASVAHANPIAIGLNCATGPDLMTDHIRTLSHMAATHVSCYPNAGLPDEDGQYPETPDSLAAQLERFIAQGWLNIVGGCCGTTAAHIRAIARMAEGKPPRTLKPPSRRAYYTGIELVEADEHSRPLIVGERTNVIGSRLFRDMIAAEKWDDASEIARRQVKNGAHIIDVCLQTSDRDEIADVDRFYGKLMPKIRTPVMIDTTDPKALERALTWCQGKSIVNSINLEDGEEKFRVVCPIVREYGAAVVVGMIDEDRERAQAIRRERKLEVARRSVDLLTGKYAMPPEDILIDPLVFPCATGDENYIGAAVETIEAIRLVKQTIPHVKTILGISNVSFGLPAAAREVVNSAFLYHATKAGLDLAIVNAEKLQRFASIPHEERKLAENLLFNPPVYEHPAPDDWRLQTHEQKIALHHFHVAAISEHFRKAVSKGLNTVADLPLAERLVKYIVEGTKGGLAADLDKSLQKGDRPLDIINGPLMAGMAEVGRLFDKSELIVAEVLQSAEVMKAAVDYLAPHLEKMQTASRAKILLATVKGDVHDIGKNLVEIILANNGFEVINLGIRVSPESLIEACRVQRPDAIGLSGLLVKSAHQMVNTASDLRARGIGIPLLVGGAALSEKFVATRIGPAYGGAVFYSRDVMSGLRIMNELASPFTREAALRSHIFTESAPPPVSPAAAGHGPAIRSSQVRTSIPLPKIPDMRRQVRDVRDLRQIWTYINPHMLYGKHLGFRGDFDELLRDRDPRALELHDRVAQAKHEAAKFMHVRAVSQFFEAGRDGNSIHLFAPGAAAPVHSFHFYRQPKPDGLCLSDYILDPVSGKRDCIGLFAATYGFMPKRLNSVVNSFWHTRCRPSPSKPPRPPPNGSIAACGRNWAFPIPRI